MTTWSHRGQPIWVSDNSGYMRLHNDESHQMGEGIRMWIMEGCFLNPVTGEWTINQKESHWLSRVENAEYKYQCDQWNGWTSQSEKNQKGSVGLLPYQLNPKLRKYTQKKGRSTIYDDDKEMINDLWEFGETMICMHDLIGHIISIQISFNLCLLLETKIKNVSLALEIYGPLCNLSDKKSSKNF